MKKSLLAITLTTISLSASASTYQGTSFNQVWDKIESNPYDSIPHNEISLGSLFKGFKSKISQSANRTISDHSDLLPHFDKLAHPNGTCLKGTWNITEDSQYTGQYKNGSQSLFIARASVAMSDTVVGKDRGFGLAGKLFPTIDPTKVVKTANFFVIDDLGGTKAKHYTDVEMTNEPAVSKTLSVIKHIAYVLKLAVSFGKADANPGIRQVYQISELEETAKAITPKWMMIKARSGQTLDIRDFRDELSMSNRAQNLFFDIYATSTVVNGAKKWKKLGYIEFTETTTSISCDHNLHFNHPKWRNNLTHK